MSTPAASRSQAARPEAEAVVYASMSTPFGTGYHFVARGGRLAASERDLAAVAEVCMQLGQAGDPRGTVFAGFATRRDAQGWWVWLRCTPQPDWQNRPGAFITGIAVRCADLAAIPGGPWRFGPENLPWVERDAVVKRLDSTPPDALRKGLFWDSLALPEPPAWPAQEDKLAAEEKLPQLIRAARTLAERPAECFQLLGENNPVAKLRWVSLLQPPAARLGLSALLQAPRGIAWRPHVLLWSDQAQVPASQTGRLWPKSAAPNTEADRLNEFIARGLADGSLTAGAFEPAGQPATCEAHWSEIQRIALLSKMVGNTRPLRSYHQNQVLELLQQAAGRPGFYNLRHLIDEAAEQPQAFAALWRLLGPQEALRQALIEAAMPVTVGVIEGWLNRCAGAAPVDLETYLRIAWAFAARLPESEWGKLSLAAVSALPASETGRWLERVATVRPLALLESEEGRKLLAAAKTLPVPAARTLAAACILTPDTTTLVWESEALRPSLLPEDIAYLPLARLATGKPGLVEHFSQQGDGHLFALWRAAASLPQLRAEALRALLGCLTRLSDEAFDEVSAELAAQPAASHTALAPLVEPSLPQARRQRLPLAFQVPDAPPQAVPPPVAASSAPPVAARNPRFFLILGVAVALLVLGAVALWWQSRPVDNLAEREYQELPATLK